MSWMQLLAVGKSIGAVKDRPTPYKMTQQNLLPKFGGAGGRTVDSPEVEARGVRVAFRPSGGGGGGGVFGSVGSRARGVQLGRAFLRPRGLKRVGAAVQGELELERVKVVRNNLMGDDLELVEGVRRARGFEAAARRGKWFEWVRERVVTWRGDVRES